MYKLSSHTINPVYYNENSELTHIAFGCIDMYVYHMCIVYIV